MAADDDIPFEFRHFQILRNVDSGLFTVNAPGGEMPNFSNMFREPPWTRTEVPYTVKPAIVTEGVELAPEARRLPAAESSDNDE